MSYNRIRKYCHFMEIKLIVQHDIMLYWLLADLSKYFNSKGV